jgi:hypothetical protein
LVPQPRQYDALSGFSFPHWSQVLISVPSV